MDTPHNGKYSAITYFSYIHIFHDHTASTMSRNDNRVRDFILKLARTVDGCERYEWYICSLLDARLKYSLYTHSHNFGWETIINCWWRLSRANRSTNLCNAHLCSSLIQLFVLFLFHCVAVWELDKSKACTMLFYTMCRPNHSLNIYKN